MLTSPLVAGRCLQLLLPHDLHMFRLIIIPALCFVSGTARDVPKMQSCN
jgi:hypothetical protein